MLKQKPRKGDHIIYDDGEKKPVEYIVGEPHKTSAILNIKNAKTDEPTLVIWTFTDGPNPYLYKKHQINQIGNATAYSTCAECGEAIKVHDSYATSTGGILCRNCANRIEPGIMSGIGKTIGDMFETNGSWRWK